MIKAKILKDFAWYKKGQIVQGDKIDGLSKMLITLDFIEIIEEDD